MKDISLIYNKAVSERRIRRFERKYGIKICDTSWVLHVLDLKDMLELLPVIEVNNKKFGRQEFAPSFLKSGDGYFVVSYRKISQEKVRTARDWTSGEFLAQIGVTKRGIAEAFFDLLESMIEGKYIDPKKLDRKKK